jgi:hypothetical protein
MKLATSSRTKAAIQGKTALKNDLGQHCNLLFLSRHYYYRDVDAIVVLMELR